jgi:hypothetical protein
MKQGSNGNYSPVGSLLKLIVMCGERRVKKHCFHEWGRKKSRVAKATSGFWSPHK